MMDLCQRCLQCEENILSDIAHSRKRSLRDLLKEMQHQRNDLSDKTERQRQERLEENRREQAETEHKQKEYEEEMSYQVMEQVFRGEAADDIAEKMAKDEVRKQLEQKVRELKYQPEEMTDQDLEGSLKDYIQRGDLDIEKGEIKFTPKGARKLANQVLRRILEKLADRRMGHRVLEELGYGVERSPSSRKYEMGDEYDKIDIERTFLNALARHPGNGGISLDPEDFQVFEEIHQTRMVAGLIIDESGSMSGDKINAAIDSSLALSELIRREPKDLLKVYLFSELVREIPAYDILNVSFAGGTTDIRAAMRAFRNGVAGEKGDKQAYLITDTEPNTEDRRFIGFDEAAAGVVEEALRYRQAGITLNIVMLDQKPQLRELATVLARKNLGRVFVTSPLKLGELVIEDYLVTKKNSRSVSYVG
ncbi:MAG: hypothetical protein Q8O05_07685 [Chloroflexota bacterium]|nr:hypothetical protein [Chloroflexota bacterium]